MHFKKYRILKIVSYTLFLSLCVCVEQLCQASEYLNCCKITNSITIQENMDLMNTECILS